VILAVALSLPIFMLTPPVARLLMLSPISPLDWAIAILCATAAVCWRAPGSRAGTPL